ASAQPARIAAFRRTQYGGDPARPARVGALRARAGLLHRGPADASRPLRTGRRRYAVPRRDRGHAGRAADPAPARPLGRAVLPRGRPPAHYVEREGDRGHAPEPRGTGSPGPVPGGSLPSPERDPAAPAATARA